MLYPEYVNKIQELAIENAMPGEIYKIYISGESFLEAMQNFMKSKI